MVSSTRCHETSVHLYAQVTSKCLAPSFSVNRECTAATRSCSMRGFWCSSVLIAGYRYCKVADIQVQSRRWSFDKSNVGVVRTGSFSKRQQGASSNSIWEVLVYEPLLFWRFPFLSWPWRLPVSIGFKAVWQQLGVQVFKITRSPSAGCPKDVRMAVDP